MCQAQPVLVKKANQMTCGSFLFKVFVWVTIAVGRFVGWRPRLDGTRQYTEDLISLAIPFKK